MKALDFAGLVLMPAAFFIMTLFAAIRKDSNCWNSGNSRFSSTSFSTSGGLHWSSGTMAPQEMGCIPGLSWILQSPSLKRLCSQSCRPYFLVRPSTGCCTQIQKCGPLPPLHCFRLLCGRRDREPAYWSRLLKLQSILN